MLINSLRMSFTILNCATQTKLSNHISTHTLENTEKPKCAVDEPCLNVIARLDPSERPLDINAHQPDPKCRFFWKMGDIPPYETAYPALNAPNVIPQNESIKARWEPVLEKWGNSMKNA